MSGSVRPHRRQPTRLPRLWDSPGKNTGMGCHFLPQCRKVKSESEIAQSCLTLSDSMDYSLPGFSVHGIFQARVLEWVPLPSRWQIFVPSLRGHQLTIGSCCCLWHPLLTDRSDHWEEEKYSTLWPCESLSSSRITLIPFLLMSVHVPSSFGLVGC